jgi:hypothetical protein
MFERPLMLWLLVFAPLMAVPGVVAMRAAIGGGSVGGAADGSVRGTDFHDRGRAAAA